MGKYFMGVLMTFVAQYILVYFKSIKAFCMMAILIYSPVFLFEEWVLDLPDATDDNFNNVLTYCAAMAVLAGFGVSALFLGIFTYAGLSTDSYHCGKAYGLLQTVLLVGILNFKENVSSEWKGWEYFSGAIITSLLILVTLDSPEKEL
jgi:hypothetical protein